MYLSDKRVQTTTDFTYLNLTFHFLKLCLQKLEGIVSIYRYVSTKTMFQRTNVSYYSLRVIKVAVNIPIY